jgi:hypothetical protein
MAATRIHLTGGLGNQLFQIAAALSQEENGTCTIETALGNPRTSKKGRAEVFSFKLPSEIHEIRIESRFSHFVSRVVGYGVRKSVVQTRSKRMEISNTLVSIAIRFVLFFLTGSSQPVFINPGIGFSQNSDRQRGKYLIGYFQSYVYADKSKSRLSSIEIPNKGVELTELTLRSNVEQPLVVHFRFGDYLAEKNFGIPSSRYYEEGIQFLWDCGGFRKIWVFSDDIRMAKETFPSHLLQHVRWIGEVDDSSAATLEAMRLGRGYVIANSTFSWWGAFLSHNESAQVVAPTPWFQFGESPRDILPNNWTKIRAFD